MKYPVVFSVLFLWSYGASFGTIDNYLSLPATPQQVIIHVTKVLADQHHHTDLHEIIVESLPLINDRLMHEGLIAPIIHDLPRDIDLWGRIYHWTQYLYFKLFYNLKSSKYPQKNNVAFFTRIDKSLGLYTMYIPDGVPYETFVKYLKEIYKKKGIEFHIEPDFNVHIAQTPDIGLEGKSLTLDQLEQLKTGALLTATASQASLNDYMAMKAALLWHQSFPTTGLRLVEPFWPPAYPYIPHFFSLWQLAPKKGEGITVAVIDTGVAAYALEGDATVLQNQDLIVKTLPGEHNFNMVSANGLDPIEQLIQVISSYSDATKFNQEYLENVLPEWIKTFLTTKDTTAFEEYLKKNGKAELVDTKGVLTTKGQQALAEITTGDSGINPQKAGINKPFTLKKMIQPYQLKEVIQELLPVPHITSSKTTFVAGHGSHTFGIIAAQEQDETDSGVTGLAPKANAIMIKAFQDTGITDKSTLISALKKAVIHQADVVNVSLKIADVLDATSPSTALLENIVNLIPYLVASSGNNGDPALPGYAGAVESYPARFVNVPFDVGAFAYKDGKAYIAPFSQYEPNTGPLFVAPGFDILSTGLIPGQTVSSEYVFMGGTSMAAPMMSGFVTLMLAEFKGLFTREQLLKVCYTAALKLHDDADWSTKVVLGVLDMRTALLMLHALARIRDDLKKYAVVTFDSEKKFDQLLAAIRSILLAPVQAYAKASLGGIDFATNFMGYFDKAQENKTTFKKEDYFIPTGPNALDDTLSYISNTVLKALGTESAAPAASLDTITTISALLTAETINLFPNLSDSMQKRLLQKETETYWSNQAAITALMQGKGLAV